MALNSNSHTDFLLEELIRSHPKRRNDITDYLVSMAVSLDPGVQSAHRIKRLHESGMATDDELKLAEKVIEWDKNRKDKAWMVGLSKNWRNFTDRLLRRRHGSLPMNIVGWKFFKG